MFKLLDHEVLPLLADWLQKELRGQKGQWGQKWCPLQQTPLVPLQKLLGDMGLAFAEVWELPLGSAQGPLLWRDRQC